MKAGFGKTFPLEGFQKKHSLLLSFSENGWEKLESFVICGVFYGQIFLTITVQGKISRIPPSKNIFSVVYIFQLIYKPGDTSTGLKFFSRAGFPAELFYEVTTHY